MATEKTDNSTAEVLERIERAERRDPTGVPCSGHPRSCDADPLSRPRRLQQPHPRATARGHGGNYSIVGVGLVALGAHVNRNTLRILRAVQLSADSALLGVTLQVDGSRFSLQPLQRVTRKASA